MSLLPKRRLSTHKELRPPSHPDKLPPYSTPAHPAPSLRTTVSGLRPWTRLHTHKQRYRFPSRHNTHPHPLNPSTLSPFASSAPSPHQAPSSLLLPQLPSTAFSSSTAKDPLRQPASSTHPTQNSRLFVLQKENARIMETLNSHNAALNNSKNALQKETIGLRAMVSAFSAFEKQDQHLAARNAFLKEVSPEPMQKTFPPLTTSPAQTWAHSSEPFLLVFLQSL